jgi:broad specificity phosphatase PhoE
VEIFVIRHGETPGNAARVVQTPDTPLSERGIEQAERLGRRLSGQGIGHILASDLTRAAMTAERLADAIGAPVEYDSLLQERNFGAVRGTAYADLDVDLFAADYAPPEGEDWATFHARVARAWARVRAVASQCDPTGQSDPTDQTPRHLAVVTHGLVCFSLAQNHFTLAPGAVAPMRFGNTSLTIVDAAPPWTVRLLNCTAHLDATSAPDGISSAL